MEQETRMSGGADAEYLFCQSKGYKMSRLVVKFPTRNRPDKFKSVFTRYLTFLSGRNDVRFIITMDEDDPTMNNPVMQ